MVYYDIHTHHLPVYPEDVAIVNCLVPVLDAGSHPGQVISRLEKADTAGCLCDPASSAGTGLFHSVGIHPWYIYDVEEQLTDLKRQAMLPGVVAIGETGLDKLVSIVGMSAGNLQSIGSFCRKPRHLFNHTLRESLGRADCVEKGT